MLYRRFRMKAIEEMTCPCCKNELQLFQLRRAHMRMRKGKGKKYAAVTGVYEWRKKR